MFVSPARYNGAKKVWFIIRKQKSHEEQESRLLQKPYLLLHLYIFKITACVLSIIITCYTWTVAFLEALVHEQMPKSAPHSWSPTHTPTHVQRNVLHHWMGIENGVEIPRENKLKQKNGLKKGKKTKSHRMGGDEPLLQFFIKCLKRTMAEKKLSKLRKEFSEESRIKSTKGSLFFSFYIYIIYKMTTRIILCNTIPRNTNAKDNAANTVRLRESIWHILEPSPSPSPNVYYVFCRVEDGTRCYNVDT